MAELEPQAETPNKVPFMSDQLFKTLEYITRVVLPAVATLYAGLGALWGFPNVTAVVGTIVAVDTFLGVLLGFAMRSYDASGAKYDGNVVVMSSPDGGKTFSLELEKNPDEIAEMSKIVFKVVPTTLP